MHKIENQNTTGSIYLMWCNEIVIAKRKLDFLFAKNKQYMSTACFLRGSLLISCGNEINYYCFT